MRILTFVIYVLFGAGAILGGIAAIVSRGYFESGRYASGALVNTVPFVLFALTAPFTRANPMEVVR